MRFNTVFAAGFVALLISTIAPSVVAEEPSVRIIPHNPSAHVFDTPEGWAQEIAKGTGTMSLFFQALLKAGNRQELLTSLLWHVLWLERQFEQNGSKRRVLIFVPHPHFFGPRILVLTDECLNVLDWSKIGSGDSVELTQEDERPVLLQRLIPEPLPFTRVQRYRLSEDRIEEYGAPYYEPVVSSPETQEERGFYAEVKRSGSEELRENLGLIPPRREKWLGEPESYIFEKRFDSQFLGRKRLKWSGTFGKGKDLRRVLIFDAGFEEWPGFQYITIVLTDREYRVRSWRMTGGKQKFREAKLLSEHGQTQLHVTFDHVNFQMPGMKTVSVEQYLIKEDGVHVVSFAPEMASPVTPANIRIRDTPEIQ